MKPWPAQTLIQERYQIISCLQQREATSTYRALDLQTHQQVILKSLSLNLMPDWQSYQLFEREIEALAALNHPCIPSLLAHFETEFENERLSVLVLEQIKGQTLRERLQSGWKLDEAQARQLALQALKILSYLQSRQPVLIHRDIKPDNLMLDAENRLYLLDFGAARSYQLQPQATAVGTFGYMAPEQALGQQAQPASDLYALGVTLVELLSGQSPQAIPRQDLRLDFKGLINVSDAFAYWLEGLLEPELKDRFKHAQEALAALKQERLPVRRSQALSSRITQQQGPHQLELRIAPASAQSLLSPAVLRLLALRLGWALLIVLGFSTLQSFGLTIFNELLLDPGNIEGTRQFYTGWARVFAWLSWGYISWELLRQLEAPLRNQRLILQGSQLTYEVEGIFSRRKRRLNLRELNSILVNAGGLLLESRQPSWLPAHFRSWLKQVPNPLTASEQSLLQRELKRYLRQELPPEEADRLISNSF